MSDSDIRQLVEDIFAMIRSGDFGKAGELIDQDYVDHSPLGELRGVDGFIQLASTFRAGFSDLDVHPVDIIVEGDRAAWRVEGTGTNDGELMGMPPTGRRVQLGGIDMGVTRDGKAIEHWTGADMLSMLQQLGVVQMPGQP